jgi:hypothetical protein
VTGGEWLAFALGATMAGGFAGVAICALWARVQALRVQLSDLGRIAVTAWAGDPAAWEAGR